MRCKLRIFATGHFGSGLKAKNSTVLVSTGGEVEGEIWVCKVWFLFRLRTGTQKVIEIMAFEQYVACVPPADAIGSPIGCILLRWENGDEDDNSFGRGSQRTESRIREQYGAEWFF